MTLDRRSFLAALCVGVVGTALPISLHIDRYDDERLAARLREGARTGKHVLIRNESFRLRETIDLSLAGDAQVSIVGCRFDYVGPRLPLGTGPIIWRGALT